MMNTRIERMEKHKRTAIVAVGCLLAALTLSLVRVGTASADHVCQLNPNPSFNVSEGGSVSLSANSVNCQFVRWDLDNDGFYDDGTGTTRTFAAGDRDGPGTQIVGIEGVTRERICEHDPESGGQICHFEDDFAYAQTTVNISNVAPTATFDVPQFPITTGDPFTLSLFTPLDPSLADRNAGFQNYFDCDGDGTFVLAVGVTNQMQCTANNGLSQTVGGRITDKDGGSTTYTGTITLNDTTKPTVLDNAGSLEPDRGALGVPRATNVSATFSEEMGANSLTSATFKLQQFNKKTRKWKTIPATITLSNGNTTATLDPFGATEPTGTEQSLAGNKKFRGLVTTGAEDLVGNPLAKTFSWTFNTGG
jgi:hypothetical protein